MESQRVILANVPPLLNEMLERAFVNVPGLRIVAEVADWAILPAVIQRTGASWVIVSVPSGPHISKLAEELLTSRPTIRLLNVATDGGHITLQWVEPRARTLDEFSMGELISLLTSPPHTDQHADPQ